MAPQDEEKLEKMVKDLFRLGDYSRWIAPKIKENLDFFSKLRKSYDDESAVAQRLEELIKNGANIKDKVYLISNVNSVEALKVAFQYGGDPNIRGKSGMTPIERAIYKGRTKIAEEIINNELFNFQADTDNVLNVAIYAGKYKLATQIISKRPNLVFEKNKNNESILYSLSNYLNNGNKINSKAITFASKVLDIADEKHIDFPSTEMHYGRTLANNSREIATLITERFALKLNRDLPKKENSITTTNNKIKL